MTDDDAFIASGLENYMEATRTIAYFRGQVAARLLDFVKKWPGSKRVTRDSSEFKQSAPGREIAISWISSRARLWSRSSFRTALLGEADSLICVHFSGQLSSPLLPQLKPTSPTKSANG